MPSRTRAQLCDTRRPCGGSGCAPTAVGAHVWLPRLLCLQSRLSGCAERGAVFSIPRGAARGYLTGLSAPRLWGCLSRFACLVAWISLLSEQIARMSRARRLLQHPKGEPPYGYLLGHLDASASPPPSSPSSCSLTHSDSLTFRLTHAQTHSPLRLTRTHIRS